MEFLSAVRSRIYLPFNHIRFQSNFRDRKIDTKIQRAIVVVESKGNAQLLDRVYSIASRFIKQTIGRVARKKLIFRSNKCTVQRNDSRKWREETRSWINFGRLITIRVRAAYPQFFIGARNVFHRDVQFGKITRTFNACAAPRQLTSFWLRFVSRPAPEFHVFTNAFTMCPTDDGN